MDDQGPETAEPAPPVDETPAAPAEPLSSEPITPGSATAESPNALLADGKAWGDWTPEASASRPALAGFRIRLGGYLLDALTSVLALAPAAALLALSPRTGWWVLAAVVGWLLQLAYFPFFWSRGGSTPGMLLTGIQVVRAEDGGRVGVWRAIGRYLAFALATLPLYLGLLWVIWDPQKRGWHDMLARTRVVFRAGSDQPHRRTALAGVFGGVATIIGGVIVIIVVATQFYSGTRDTSGRITEAQEISVFGLRVGDCFDIPQAGLKNSVIAEPCSNPHGYEAFAESVLSGAEYPSQGGLVQAAGDACVPAFESYVGEALGSSTLDATYIAPNASVWRTGNHKLLCIAFETSGAKLQRSVRSGS